MGGFPAQSDFHAHLGMAYANGGGGFLGPFFIGRFPHAPLLEVIPTPLPPPPPQINGVWNMIPFSAIMDL